MSVVMELSRRATYNGLEFGVVDDDGVRWALTDLTGWGSPAGTLEVQQRPRANGGRGGESFLTPAVMTFKVAILAPTVDLLTDAADRLFAAVELAEAKFEIVEGSRTRYRWCRRQDEIIPTLYNARSAEFSVQVVAEDPLKYGEQITASTLLPSSSGGLTWPVTWPVTWTGVTQTGVLHIDNPGNVPAPIMARVDAIGEPLDGPIIKHLSQGRELVFSSSYQLPAGNWLDIDMANHKVRENGQASRSTWVTKRGWFSLDPGGNDILFDANTRNSTARLTITTYPAWQ